MRVLVTGGTGFLGSHCVEALVAAGHDVRLLARTPAKIAATFDPLGVRIESHEQGDMADPEVVGRALDGCDAVLHAAATMYGGADVLDANLAGVRNVIGGAVTRGIDPLIYVSSVGAMFPPAGPVITVDDPIGEHETVYGRSKAEGERYNRTQQAEGAPVTSIYPGGIYAPRDPVVGETMKGLRDAIRFGWPMTTGGVSIVDARDLAHIVTACLEAERGPRRYLASGHFLTWSEFATCCETLTGKRMRRVPAPPVLVRTFGRIIDLLQRVIPSFEYPLTYEAALFLTQLVPGDDSATEKDLGIVLRPTLETLSDSIEWLAEVGELDARHAGKLAASPGST
jgi:dihydroflavonol-4-reductase